ncbi:MAG: hypothetical protein JO101_02850 [Candidatus Eremiobacteraeota bacterium]|nr:hypothetical protein [Candidatus Eremiobacteraeota bacterium]MBV8354230.1 hypothetical protein [Candidatus Eremiobacteraeota bacterium]
MREFGKLRRAVEEHIRYEEGKIHPLAQKLLTREQLGMLGDEFMEAKGLVAATKSISGARMTAARGDEAHDRHLNPMGPTELEGVRGPGITPKG